MEVGDTVILGVVLDEETIAPVRHDSRREFPCRGVVTGIGRKYVYVTTRGGTWPALIIPEVGQVSAFPIEEGRRLYRNAFRNDPRPVDAIELMVASL